MKYDPVKDFLYAFFLSFVCLSWQVFYVMQFWIWSSKYNLRHFNVFFVDLMALTVKVIAVTLRIEVPVKAADIAENFSLMMETVFNNFSSVMLKKLFLQCHKWSWRVFTELAETLPFNSELTWLTDYVTERSTELNSTGLFGLCYVKCYFYKIEKKTNSFISLNWIFQAMNDT